MARHLNDKTDMKEQLTFNFLRALNFFISSTDSDKCNFGARPRSYKKWYN